eukprot:2947886-Heterocapsa_arctica.AAC.1
MRRQRHPHPEGQRHQRSQGQRHRCWRIIPLLNGSREACAAVSLVVKATAVLGSAGRRGHA